ncbi:FAD-linked oxidase C-terminal domain-containing protein, partial [Neisseria sp. P0015.S010]
AYQNEDAVKTIFYENILACHGTIAAEHVVGIIKKHWLPRVRTHAELVLMQTIKNQLDTNGIMNQDKLLPSLD